MKKWVKKTIKTTIISIISVFGAVIVLGGIALYIILSPTRLTPIVESIAKEFIDAELDFEAVELTVFETFPRIGVRLQNGVLKSNNKNSAAMNDTIVSFKMAGILMNPLKFVFEDKLEIQRIYLRGANIYGYIDSTGKANWDVFKIDSSTQDTAKFNLSANLDLVEIVDGKATFDDRKNAIFGRIKRINGKMSGKMDADSKIKGEIKIDTALFWKDGNVLVRRTNIDVNVMARNVADEKTLYIDNIDLVINNLKANIKGAVNAKKADVIANIESDSIASVLDMVPKLYLDQKAKIQTKGGFKAEVDLKWVYEKAPVADVRITTKEIGFMYEGFLYGVDKFDADIFAHIDLTKETKSSLDVNQLKVKATAIDLDLKGKLDDIFGKAFFSADIKVDVNLGNLSKTLPFGDSIQMNGDVEFIGKLVSNVSDIQNLQWKHLNASGELTMQNVELDDFRKEFTFRNNFSKLTLQSSKEGSTAIKGHLGDVEAVKIGLFDVRLKNSDTSLELFKIKDSITQIVGEIGYNTLALELPKDSIIFSSSASVVNIDLTDWLKIKLKTDTLGLDMMRSKAVLDSAYIDARIAVKGKRRIGGNFQFRELAIISNYFPLPIVIGSAKLSLQRDVFDLSKIDIKIGGSDFQLSGKAEGVFKAMRSSEKIKIRGLLKSKIVNINELMSASLALPFMSDEEVDKTDSIQKQVEVAIENKQIPLFVIPENIEANFTANIDTIIFSDIVLTKTRGGVQVNDKKFRIRRIVSHFEGSQFALRALYNSSVADSVELAFSVDAKDINVKKVTTMFPYLDSLTPIIRSVDGLVNFDLVGSTKFFKHYDVDIANFDATVMFTAQKVSVPENETLKSVAKMLMFKNKQIMNVDSVSLQMVANKGNVEILPFIMDVDRYRVAVGGKQGYVGDMDMNYHVSVLKSPVPIKFGVNISGNIEDWNVGIGKTQYKYLQGKDYKGYINPQYIEKREKLFAPLVTQRRKEN